MKICSFLPSATEILFALGAGDEVVGVTFECDFPAAAAGKPVVVRSSMQSGLSPREIDDAVRAAARDGGSLTFVDWPVLETLAPELILTQDLCRVCAISTPTVARDLAQLSSHPRVLSMSPHSLAEVFADILSTGEATGRRAAAAALTAALQARVAAVRLSAEQRALPRPRVLCLEWLDPLYQGGHWIPEMVGLAGGEAVLATPGGKSVRLGWDDVIVAQPEVIVLMPCGFHLQDTVEQYRSAAWAANLPAAWHALPAVRHGEIYAVDGTAYFSRPGPRLVEGLEILQAILSGEGRASLPPDSMARL